MVEAASEVVPLGARVRIAIMHGHCPSRAEELRTKILGSYQVQELIVNQIGPVIGVHVGPGAIGLVVVPS